MTRRYTARFLNGVMAAFLFVLAAPSTFAQQADTTKLAAEIAAFLTNPRYVPAPADGGKRRVVVVPFARDGETTQFGAALAVDIARELASTTDKLTVVDPEMIRLEAATSGLWAEDLATDTIACWLAETFGSSYALAGTFTRSRNAIRVNVKGIPCGKGMKGFRMRADIAVAPEMLDRIARDRTFPGVVVPVPAAKEDRPIVAQGGKDGIGHPSCKRCPDPSFTQSARANDTQGAVLLRLIVTPEGRARNVRLVRGLPHGLNAEAIRVVSRWEFEPARNAEGKPVPVWVTVEVYFRRL